MRLREPETLMGIAREKNMIVVTTTKKWFRRLADRKVPSRGHARILSERGQNGSPTGQVLLSGIGTRPPKGNRATDLTI